MKIAKDQQRFIELVEENFRLRKLIKFCLPFLRFHEDLYKEARYLTDGREPVKL